MAMGLRAALAAMLAWSLAAPLGGVADQYLYYAPFGAVVAVSTTVIRSVSTSVQVFLAIGLGAALAVAVQELSVSSAIGIGLVVLVGTLASRLRWLGESGSWVPIAALFVLILGQGHEERFVLGYLGLTSLGALVGTGVNLAFPPLLLEQTERAQAALRAALVDQLDALAGDLERGVVPDATAPGHAAGELRGRGRAVEDLVSNALEGPPVNWRVRRWRGQADLLRAQGTALVGLALLVGELADTLRHREGAGNQEGALFRTDLEVPAAQALRATARALSSETERADEAMALAGNRIDELADAVRRTRAEQGESMFVAGALVLGLRSALATLKASEAEDH